MTGPTRGVCLVSVCLWLAWQPRPAAAPVSCAGSFTCSRIHPVVPEGQRGGRPGAGCWGPAGALSQTGSLMETDADAQQEIGARDLQEERLRWDWRGGVCVEGLESLKRRSVSIQR